MRAVQPLSLCALMAGLFFAVVPACAAPMLPVYGPATPADELNSPSNDWADSISFDGLKIVIHSARNGLGDRLFSATRASPADPFSTPTDAEFVNINTTAFDIRMGVISPSGLELFYTAESVGPPATQIMRATRASAAAPFGSPQALSGLQIGSSLHFPNFISADAKRLYYWNSSGQLFVTARADVGSPFGAPSAAPFVNMPYAENLYLTQDELEMYFNSGDRIWWTWRPDLNTPFAAAQSVESINAGSSGAGPVLFGNSLHFTRGLDILRATLIPEPGVLCPSVLAALALRRRRWG